MPAWVCPPSDVGPWRQRASSRAAPPPKRARGGSARSHGAAAAGDRPPATSRRAQLAAAAAALLGGPAAAATSAAQQPPLASADGLADLVRAAAPAWPAAGAELSIPNYAAPGPFMAAQLPLLEHTCAPCFPQCAGDRCLVRLSVFYPKGGTRVGLRPPYPLAILSSGFLVGRDQYQAYARRLATWGYVAVLYDRKESALDPMTDTLAAAILHEIIDWCGSDPLLRVLADPQRVLLAGHSRGAKVATLAALRDDRVRALFLLDPVDVTVFAPLGPGFPSATAGLRALGASGRALPVAVVGAGLGGDCAPPDSNHSLYYSAASAPAWEVVVESAGHLQFLESRGALLQDAVCAAGAAPDEAVRELACAMLVAWAEAMVRPAAGAGGGQSGPLPRVRMGLDCDGNVVAGVAAFDVVRSLFATEGAALRLLGSAAAGGGALRVTTRLRNFSLDPGEAPRSY